MTATPETAPVQTFKSDDEVADSIASLPADALAFEDDEREEAAKPAEQEPAEEEEQPEEEAEAEPEEEGEEEAEAESDEDPVFEVTLPGGETAEVPLSELAAGYSRLQDYKAKTAEVAEMKRQAEQERLQELARVQETQGQLRQILEQYQALNPVGQPPSIAMLDPNSADYNPDRYHLEKAQYDQRLGNYYQSQQHLQRVREENERMEAEQRQTTINQEMGKLKEAWPEFYDDATKSEVRKSFLDGLQQHFGIDPQTVSSVHDHRFYLMAKDALAFRGVKKDAPKVSARLKTKPKVVKPGTRTQSKPQVKQLAESRKALRRSGSTRDAEAFFEQAIDSGLIS